MIIQTPAINICPCGTDILFKKQQPCWFATQILSLLTKDQRCLSPSRRVPAGRRVSPLRLRNRQTRNNRLCVVSETNPVNAIGRLQFTGRH